MATDQRADTRKREVRRFWDARPCGSAHGEGAEATQEWYAAIERRRQELEPFIERFADFPAARDRQVLEIGVGVGTDLVRFARAGAHVTGVDLSERSVELARRRLRLENLPGEVLVADAEALPFRDCSFDFVYSWGVLHHTPDTAHAVREAIRVLRPGGRLVLMLYARRSWVGFGLWTWHALLRARPWTSLNDVLGAHIESAGTKGFTLPEVRAMLTGMTELELERVLTPYDRRVAGPIAAVVGRRLGWFIVARGRANAK